MAFRYQEGEILDHSLTSTNFHTYYQGSEMVVAGQLPGNPSSKMLEYEITANQAGGKYVVSGSHDTTSMVCPMVIWVKISVVLGFYFIITEYPLNTYYTFQAFAYPETITETVFDIVPSQETQESVVSVNFLERLWGRKYLHFIFYT